MRVKSYTNYIHISPRKVKLVVDLIRGLGVEEAEEQLLVCKKRAAEVVLKSLKSAVAAAKHNFSLDKKNLYISEIRVDQGPSMKKWQAAAFGVAHPITRKTSHLTIVLEEKVKSDKHVKETEKKIQESQKLTEEKKEKESKSERVRKEKRVEKKLPKISQRKKEVKTKVFEQRKGFIRRIFQRKSGV